MRTLVFILCLVCPVFLQTIYSQEVQLNLPSTYDQGRKLEFVSYPMFALSSFSLGMSNEFGKKDTEKSNRPLIYGIIGTTGLVGSMGTWGVGISLQGKPKWTVLLKLVGASAISYIGYESGRQATGIFKHK